jgi:hypothetical protein
VVVAGCGRQATRRTREAGSGKREAGRDLETDLKGDLKTDLEGDLKTDLKTDRRTVFLLPLPASLFPLIAPTRP